MPLSEERKAELLRRYGASRAAAPVVLSEPDQMTEDQKSKTIIDMFVGEQPAPVPSGLTDERKAELLAMYGKKSEPQQPEQVGVAEDVAKSIGGGIVRGAVATPMVIGNLLNEAVAAPQYLYEGLVGQDRKDFQPYRPFYSSEEVAQMLPEGLRPYTPKTGYGVAADIVGQLGGGVASGAAIMKAPQAVNAAKSSKFIADEGSGGLSAAEKLSRTVAKNEAKSGKFVDLYKDMLNNFKQVDDVNKTNFDNLSAISSKTEMVDVRPLQSGVKSIIKELEDAPASPERANLTFFKRVEKTIDKGEKLPVSDVVELQKFLNSRYNPKKVGSAEKLSEAQLFNQTKSILDGYGARNPTWNKAYKQAQGFFANEVAPLKSDFVLKKGFDVNDAKIIERFNRGELKQLPDDLIARARQLPSKINDDVAYNRLAPLVSPDKQKEFGKMVVSEAVPEGSRSGNPATRLLRTGAYGVGAFASGGSPYMRARFAAELAGMVKGQDPLYPLIKRGVQPIGERIAPEMTKAQRLAEAIAKQPPAGQKALPYYPPQQQTPEILVGATGAARPATQGETMAQALIRTEMQRTGQYPMAGVGGENLASARAAASAGESDFLRQYGTAKMLGNENMNIPQGVPPEPAGWRGNAAFIQAEKAAAIQKAAQEQAMQDQIAKMSVVTADDAAASAVALRDLEAATGAARKNTAMEEKLLEALKKSSPTKTTITPKDKRK